VAAATAQLYRAAIAGTRGGRAAPAVAAGDVAGQARC